MLYSLHPIHISSTMIRLFLSCVVLYLVVACSSAPEVAQSTPEEAIRGLFEALKEQDFEKAKLYGTSSTQKSLQDFATNLKMISDDEKAQLLAPFQMTVAKVSCREESGAMFCSLCCSSEGDIKIEMVQQDNKWFAQVDFAY